MLLARLQSLGILLICAALAVAGWKTVAARRAGQVVGGGDTPGAAAVSPGRGELTIPVEIVVSGEEPRLREIRVSR